MHRKNEPIRLALVDDHQLFRSGIASLLAEYSDLFMVFEAANGKELMEKMALEQEIDLVLLDINMPIMNGYETAAWLYQHYPSVNVLALSMYDDEKAIISMLRVGAKGYLLKESSAAELHHAITKVHEKGYYTNDLITGNMIKSFQPAVSAHTLPTFSLTEKETLFLQLCATDLTYKEMADQLGIAPRSVDNYSRILFEKTGVKSRVGLVIWAIKNQLVVLP